jgi:hypothetical protein
MEAIHYKYNTKPIAIVCALILFTAVFYWPVKYYTFLRIVIFLGAILVVIPHNIKQLHWTVIFCIIAVIFNPILPIYLHTKSHWIPIDIASGILFLLEAFVKIKKLKIN